MTFTQQNREASGKSVGENWLDIMAGLQAQITQLRMDHQAALIEAVQAERTRIAAWLRHDADLTEQESIRIVKNTSGNPRKNFAEWQMLVGVKRGVADAIERGEPTTIAGGK